MAPFITGINTLAQITSIRGLPGGWGTMFVLTAYLLLITEAVGTYVGLHFLWIAKESSSKAVQA
jgi:hypothetical protein